MSSAAGLTGHVRLVAALIFFTAPTAYLASERYASLSHVPAYSYLINLTSDLGVPFPYVDSGTGQIIYSARAAVLNANFALNGILYLVGHICLLKGAHLQRLYNARLGIAGFYCIGALLVATHPAAEKLEHEGGGFALTHIFGAFLTLAGGNVNCILAGLTAPKQSRSRYCSLSLLAGATGFLSLPLFLILGSIIKIDGHILRGLWQRLSIYPFLSWEYATAIMLAAEYCQMHMDSKKV